MASADEIAAAFVKHYYNTFDTDRNQLASLYKDQSMLTFEGERFLGAQAIQGKLASLAFQHCRHIVSTVDCQPSGVPEGMIVFVSGNLQVEGEQHVLKFSQMFHIVKGDGTYYVFNDIFRLNYA